MPSETHYDEEKKRSKKLVRLCSKTKITIRDKINLKTLLHHYTTEFIFRFKIGDRLLNQNLLKTFSSHSNFHFPTRKKCTKPSLNIMTLHKLKYYLQLKL